jgi:hypothetical protein
MSLELYPEQVVIRGFSGEAVPVLGQYYIHATLGDELSQSIETRTVQIRSGYPPDTLSSNSPTISYLFCWQYSLKTSSC